jgi:hypothetical protein
MGMSDAVTFSKQYVPIIKLDSERRLIKGVVYEPNTLDAQGDWMTPEDIEETAHRFMKELKQQNVDTKHDLQKVDAYVCESYIAKANDPEGYPEGAWVVAIKVDDDDVWAGVLAGEYEGLSMFGRGLAIEDIDPPSQDTIEGIE